MTLALNLCLCLPNEIYDVISARSLLRRKMLLGVGLIILSLGSSSALLISADNRRSTRNITCRQDATAPTAYAPDCEACLMTSRNYPVSTSLSLTGSAPSGISYRCLRVNEVEAYHESLVRECLNFSRNLLSGYGDYCIATPYNLARGSYRACLCTTNRCNSNYTQCNRTNTLYARDRTSNVFTNTIAELKDRIRCYRSGSGGNDRPTFGSALTPLCAAGNEECENYVYDQSVLCAISIDRFNQTSRVSLPPSMYSDYLIRLKTQVCDSFSWRSKSIYFSGCQQNSIVCMCAKDDCDKDLETCRSSRATHSVDYSSCFLLLLLFTLNI